MDVVLNVAFVVAAVAFFKKQFGWSGWQPILAAFVLSVIVAFLPDLYAAFPMAKVVLEKLIGIIALFLAAPGVFDLAVDIRSR